MRIGSHPGRIPPLKVIVDPIVQPIVAELLQVIVEPIVELIPGVPPLSSICGGVPSKDMRKHTMFKPIVENHSETKRLKQDLSQAMY